MTALLVEARRPIDRPADDGFEVSYVAGDGAEHRVPLSHAWAVPFEQGIPVRRFPSRQGQRHLSGSWWSATTGGHVGFESWLERDWLLHLDFDPSVVGIASQPFWLHWSDAAGTTVSHAPDFFARRRDGSAVVVDCRPVERRKPRDVAKFDATARACALVGWDYRLLGAAEALVTANLRWLAGYRHVRHYGRRPDRSLAGVVPPAVVPRTQDRRVDAAASGHAGEPAGGSAVTLTQAAVLRPGDWVRYDGVEHQVIALAGTSVRLRSDNGAESVVLVAYLLASAEFALIDGAPMPSMEPFGLLDGLPVKVLEEAREWERHIMEVETGLPPNSLPGATPRAGFDPANTTIAERDQAKAAELGVSLRTVKARRARYARQGLWGLVDQRAVRLSEATGRADARLVAAIRQVVDAETDTSTGTRSRLIRRVVKAVEATYGPGVVPLPGRSTFYKVIDAVSSGRHTFGSAVTRRQTANRPQGLFTPTHAARPGEQVQIDSTPIDVLVLLDNGVPVRADLTIAVDVATRTICAAVLRPVGTKAVDAALLLAKMLVPEPMRPSWSAALRMSASRLPHARLVDIDTRMELAAARPVIVPDTIVIDGGKVFVSDTFTRACERLGVSVQRARPRTPTDKAIVEATFGSINTLFCQHVAAYTGSNTTLRGLDATGAWTLPELQDLLDEWLLVGWQPRPHDALRDPLLPRRALSPNEMYAVLVAAAGYLPLTLSGEDYLELLPIEWRQINAYGIRIDYRTYDCVELGPWRLQHSGVTARRGLWEVHYDPYDATHVFVRTPDGWVTVPWTHLPMVGAPFAEFTWRHARTLAAEKGLDDTNETEVARVLDDLLSRAQAGPVSKLSDRIAARTRVAAAAHRPPPREDPSDDGAMAAEPGKPVDGDDDGPLATVIPFGIFDADAEAERW